MRRHVTLATNLHDEIAEVTSVYKRLSDFVRQNATSERVAFGAVPRWRSSSADHVRRSTDCALRRSASASRPATGESCAAGRAPPSFRSQHPSTTVLSALEC